MTILGLHDMRIVSAMLRSPPPAFRLVASLRSKEYGQSQHPPTSLSNIQRPGGGDNDGASPHYTINIHRSGCRVRIFSRCAATASSREIAAHTSPNRPSVSCRRQECLGSAQDQEDARNRCCK